MQNSTYMQKRIVYASIKPLQIKILPCQEQRGLLYETSCILSIVLLGSQVSTAIKCSVLMLGY